MKIRELLINDAEKFIALNLQLSKESKYMLLTPAEAGISREKQQDMIHSMKNTGNSMVFVTEEREKLVGFIGITRGSFEKNIHTCHFALGVLKAYQRKNIATNLLQNMERWAASSSIIRIELSVMTENIPAISLYYKSGYSVDGLKVASLKIGNKKFDELQMYKLLQ